MIVVATDEEYKLAKKRYPHKKIVQTGVGALNVIHTLKKYPKWIPIINFGYAGSNNIQVGTEVNVGYCVHYHPNVNYLEPAYMLNNNSVVCCYTSNDFVLKTDIVRPVVFDMELAYIMALGFRNVKSIKIVSDNLSLKKYEETIKEN